MINNYNSTLQKLTDKYAPLQCKTIPLRPHAPWYTSALRHEKRVRRRSERVAARMMLDRFQCLLLQQNIDIRSELGLPGLYKCGSMTTSFSGTPLSTFMDATEIEIRNIIKLSPAKSCELDPLPTWLLKECIAELVPTITDIVNMSLRDSLMPTFIRPLLKKTGLDSDILKNFRPVSNLTFISKVIEKVVSGRLNEHLIKNSMF